MAARLAKRAAKAYSRWSQTAAGGRGAVRLSMIPESKPKIAVLTLENWESSNALTGRMMCELNDRVLHLADTSLHPDLVGLILTGAEGTFCAGADLNFAAAELETAEDGALMSALMSTTLQQLRQLPLVSVAAIDGFAVGGGAELSTATDFRVMTPSSSVRFVQVKLGVSPGWGGGGRLTSLVGRRMALRLLGTGTPTPAVTALSIGLADHVAPEGVAALEAATDFLQPYADQANPAAVRAIKQVVAIADSGASDDEAMHQEALVFEQMWGIKPLPSVNDAKANANT